jgi:DNA repair protein RAD7
MAADPPPGYLCYTCAKASGADPFKKTPVLRKRKPATERRNVIHHQEMKFPTLVSLCVKVRVTVRWLLCPLKLTALSVR